MTTELQDLRLYRQYIEDNLDRIDRDGWTPVCFAEFRTSEECTGYSDSSDVLLTKGVYVRPKDSTSAAREAAAIEAYEDQQGTIATLQSALRAIVARVDGVWDDPDLMAIGELFPDDGDDVVRIAKAVLIVTGD